MIAEGYLTAPRFYQGISFYKIRDHMCLYPTLIKNPKYKKNKKNKGKIPPIKDKRTMWVPIGCGKCKECRKQKSNEWKVRLNEELKNSKNAIFVTLTFNEEALSKIKDHENGNEFAANEVRLFIKRIVKKYKKSVKHWLITELGHENTERIHLHGIIFEKWTNEELEKIWNRGWTYAGEYCNEKTIGYIVKYITKTDEKHKDFMGKIFASKGLGKEYLLKKDAKNNSYKGENTDECYRLPNGKKIALPIYYRNKIYSEEEREKLWINKLDKNERWVNGQQIKVDTEAGFNEYIKAVKYAQKINESMGYGKKEKWSVEKYKKNVKKICK